VKTCCPHAENINETDANIFNRVQSSGYGFLEKNKNYYVEKSVLRHFIRDPSGVFFVCHLCECRIVQ